ncbi:hypothetical protein [Paramicrobacterium chengjingii]|uniref:BMP family ABC transporter substrate-binding protein n=1 Tax=Paramicrobacterium chengjingii TaxID=2769067 RepID=A0ABX6YGV1_9MICO|nr:hypothetical protein [Microbacterium chengjingii]QPZ38023.1 hypothetical protein HCR76_14665 [Microbacterium chengjingii]
MKRTAGTALILAAAFALTACAPGSADGMSRGATTAQGDAAGPSPSATPSPGSTHDVPQNLPAIPAGVRVSLVLAQGHDEKIPDAVEHTLGEIDAELAVITADPASVVSDLASAAAGDADVVVVVGTALLASLDSASAQLLDQQFLVIGGQLPEPTENVTAVVWSGADARVPGSEIPGNLVATLPEAVTAGLAVISDGGSGMVYTLP